jgi:hypothetical protein
MHRGAIYNPGSNACMDTFGKKDAGDKIGLYPCHDSSGVQGSTQDFVLSRKNELRLPINNFDICVDRGNARCTPFDRNLHSSMPLDPTHVRLKRVLEVSRRVTNGIPLGCSLLLPVHAVYCVQTLKADALFIYDCHGGTPPHPHPPTHPRTPTHLATMTMLRFLSATSS